MGFGLSFQMLRCGGVGGEGGGWDGDDSLEQR